MNSNTFSIFWEVARCEKWISQFKCWQLENLYYVKKYGNNDICKNSMWMIISFFITERWTEREVMYVSYVGKLFLRMLKALILPLIVPSLVAAVGSLDMSISGKVNGNIFTVTKSQKFSLLWFLFPLLLGYIVVLKNPMLDTILYIEKAISQN